ncbi:MAG: OmpA family protein [Crocinitomicaceae bacterium]
MKTALLIVCVICFSYDTLLAQNFFEGTWQGVLQQNGMSNKKSVAFWLTISIDEKTGDFVGQSRCETPFKSFYALKTVKGKLKETNGIFFEEMMLGNQKNEGNNYWCLYNSTLIYDDSTGYLSGNYLSKDCRSNSGKIVLFKSKYDMSESDTVSKYHSWVTNFENDLKRGWNAYYVRDKSMRNFEIEPVYFAHDKDLVKDDAELYLQKMVSVVMSHSDLRIRIIGHTDSNGSNRYNIDLSERRANNVKSLLVKYGLPADRVEIEYRGENDPAATNFTLIGKQLNRRVDFEFD